MVDVVSKKTVVEREGITFDQQATVVSNAVTDFPELTTEIPRVDVGVDCMCFEDSSTFTENDLDDLYFARLKVKKSNQFEALKMYAGSYKIFCKKNGKYRRLRYDLGRLVNVDVDTARKIHLVVKVNAMQNREENVMKRKNQNKD